MEMKRINVKLFDTFFRQILHLYLKMKRINVKLFGRETKNRLLNWIVRNISLIAWYRNFSYYGESYFLPMLWIFAIIVVLFPLLLSTDPLTSAQIFFQATPDNLNEKVSDFIINLNGIYSNLNIGEFAVNSGWLVLLERISGILFIALFVLALRRKFKKGGE